MVYWGAQLWAAACEGVLVHLVWGEGVHTCDCQHTRGGQKPMTSCTRKFREPQGLQAFSRHSWEARVRNLLSPNPCPGSQRLSAQVDPELLTFLHVILCKGLNLCTAVSSLFQMKIIIKESQHIVMAVELSVVHGGCYCHSLQPWNLVLTQLLPCSLMCNLRQISFLLWASISPFKSKLLSPSPNSRLPSSASEAEQAPPRLPPLARPPPGLEEEGGEI